jgi:F0F1-type ATP synthase assembly protein I
MSEDLDNLEKRIHEARHKPLTEAQKRDAENMSNGMRAGVELVGAIGAGAFIGWLMDGWLETRPVFLIIMLLLGIAAGFYNVYKISQNAGSAVGFSQLHRRETGAKNAPVKRESQDKTD